MAKNVLVPVADGSEELETVAIVDVLRRAGANVTLAAIKGLTDRPAAVLNRSGKSGREESGFYWH